MAVVTLYRLAEEIKRVLDGGDPPLASATTIPEIKIAIGQVINQLLKTEYFEVNVTGRNLIPDGYVMATYEGIVPEQWVNGRSKATLPIKPMMLPRGIGVYSVYVEDLPDREFIPIGMGRTSLLKSQPMINDLLNQIGYEVKGMELRFTKDLTQLYQGKTITIEMPISDISTLGDYDVLPIPPEYEWTVKQEVIKLYSQEPIPDKIVDSNVKERKDIPVNQQTQ